MKARAEGPGRPPAVARQPSPRRCPLFRSGRPGRGASVVLVVTLAAALAAPARAQSPSRDAQDSGSSNEGALFLLLPVGAKAVALGRAMTALAGAESVWWNPAGLAEVREGRFLVYRGDHLAGEATAASAILTHSALGTGGISYQLLDVGTIDVTDTGGNVVGKLVGRNHLGVISLATRFWQKLGVGLNFKIVQSRFTCQGQCTDAGVTATTFAVDSGVQFSGLAGLPLRIGAMVAHAGSDLQIVNEEQADPLPTRLRVAAAYDVLGHFIDSDELGLSVAVELEDRWRNPGKPAKYVGTEFTAGSGEALYVRAGYVFGAEQQVDGAAVGVGLRYDRFDLALAKSLATSGLAGESEPVHISFGFVF